LLFVPCDFLCRPWPGLGSVLCAARSRWAFYVGLGRFLGLFARASYDLALTALTRNTLVAVAVAAFCCWAFAVAVRRSGFLTPSAFFHVVFWTVGVAHVKELGTSWAVRAAFFAAVVVCLVIVAPAALVASVEMITAVVAVVTEIYTQEHTVLEDSSKMFNSRSGHSCD